MTFTTLTKEETTQLIPGKAGQLELIVGKTSETPKGWAIVCHPHPLFGGTMHNKVVTTITKTYQQLGFNTVRFNFRGVGKSEGAFDQGNGELEDLLSVMAWVQVEYPETAFVLAGFSFGGYVATKAATQIPVQHLVAVAPAVENFPMKDLPAILCPWILVQGEKDDVVSADAVFAWAENREPQPIVLRFPEAGHFFHGQLGELKMRLEEAIKLLLV